MTASRLTRYASVLRRMRRRRGFTLIEVLIVVVVIGIMSSVAMPNFVSAQDRARNASATSNLKVVQQALEAYAADHGGMLPTNADFLTADGLGANGYLPGDKMPKSPWHSDRQDARISTGNYPGMCAEWVQDPAYARPEPGALFPDRTAILKRVKVKAGGGDDVPSAYNDFGAITTDTEDADNNGDRTVYAINAVGKAGPRAVLAGFVTNGNK